MDPTADLSRVEETIAYRRWRAGRKISRRRARHLAALTRMERDMLEQIAEGLDQSDRQMRRARRNGIAVIDGGRYLPPIVCMASTRPLARRRGAGRPGQRRCRRTRAGPDDGPEPPGPAARLAPPPKAILAYACLDADRRGEGT
jgi:hypothetical protein